MNDFVSIGDIQNENIDNFVKDAELTKTSKKGVGGRPKKKKKADHYFSVYVTDEERQKILEYSEERGMSVSFLFKSIMKEKGII